MSTFRYIITAWVIAFGAFAVADLLIWFKLRDAGFGSDVTVIAAIELGKDVVMVAFAIAVWAVVSIAAILRRRFA